MNDYLIRLLRDVPRVAREGMALRRRWPETDGALGLWFAAFRGGRRQVSISVWRSPEDLSPSSAHRYTGGSCASIATQGRCTRTHGRPSASTGR